MSFTVVHIQAIDDLGVLKAQIAELEQQEKALVEEIKQKLLKAGRQEAEGAIFRATLSSAERVSIDSKAVKTRFPEGAFPELYQSTLVESLRWDANPGMKERDYTTRKRQNDYSATVRCDWVDFVDHLARSGEITEKLAQRVTL